jgi:hypothetical protein
MCLKKGFTLGDPISPYLYILVADILQPMIRKAYADAMLIHPIESMMTHKYRGSQQSSREVKPKFIDSTQGEPKNTYKP